MDSDAAKELVAIVGSGQQRLAREIEKLVLGVHPETRITTEDVDELAAGETPPKVYDLADAVVGQDLRRALALAEELALGESPSRLVYPVVRRLREVHRVLVLLDAGVTEKDVAGADEDAALDGQEGDRAGAHRRPRDGGAGPVPVRRPGAGGARRRNARRAHRGNARDGPRGGVATTRELGIPKY